jgi:hypothetical protein
MLPDQFTKQPLENMGRYRRGFDLACRDYSFRIGIFTYSDPA